MPFPGRGRLSKVISGGKRIMVPQFIGLA